MSYAYLLALLFSLTGLAIADWRFKLAFFANHSRAVRSLVLAVCFFVIWDILGIVLRVFYVGDSRFISGIFLGPDFPLEEIFFLVLLCYSTLIVWRGLQKL